MLHLEEGSPWSQAVYVLFLSSGLTLGWGSLWGWGVAWNEQTANETGPAWYPHCPGLKGGTTRSLATGRRSTHVELLINTNSNMRQQHKQNVKENGQAKCLDKLKKKKKTRKAACYCSWGRIRRRGGMQDLPSRGGRLAGVSRIILLYFF